MNILKNATVSDFKNCDDVMDTLKYMVNMYLGTNDGEMFDSKTLIIDVYNRSNGSRAWQDICIYDTVLHETILMLTELIAC